MHRPGTLWEVAELTEVFLTHYNRERPNQARSCGNHPPRVACPAFPKLPAVPQTVVTLRWLVQIDKHAFARTMRAGGDLSINHQDYYVSRGLAGQRVTCSFNAAGKCFDIWQPGGRIKSVPIKGEASPGDAFRGVCGADEAGSALGIPTVSTHPSQVDPGPPVGLSLQPAQQEEVRHPHQEFPARDALSLCLRLVKRR